MPVYFDCIVVGSGPSGSITAGCLSGGGMRVLLLEAKGLPRDKMCGGLLSVRAKEEVPFDMEDYLTADREVRTIEYHFDKDVDIHDDKNCLGYLIERKDFDYELVRQAQKSGVDVLDRMRVDSVERKNGHYIVKSGRYSFSSGYIVGADGANSIVSKELGFGSYFDRCFSGFAVGASIPVNLRTPNTCRLYSIPVPTGLGWCFTGRGLLNVGLGASMCYSKRLTKMVERFAGRVEKDIGVAIPRNSFGGGVLNTCVWKRCVARENAFLVGDAAGLAEPFSGEGIYAAVVSGREAADSIIDDKRVKGQDGARRYSTAIYEKLVRDYRHSVLLAICRRRMEELGLKGPGYIGAGMIAGIMKGEESYGLINRRLVKDLLM